MLDGMESVQYWCQIPRQVNVQGENVVGRNWIRWKGKCWVKEDDEPADQAHLCSQADATNTNTWVIYIDVDGPSN
jgi:hypothetical protein